MTLEELARTVKIDEPDKVTFLKICAENKFTTKVNHIFNAGEEIKVTAETPLSEMKIFIEIEFDNNGLFAIVNYL